MNPVITAFETSPDRGRGLARDFRVRWALEELGLRYDVRALSFTAMKEAAHRDLQPFGQIPTFEADGVALFETGAIVLHLAERHAGLLPTGPAARARALSWMFGAVSTMEPPIVERSMAVLLEQDKPWFAARMPMLEERIHRRLDELSAYLGESEWLDDAFSAGDLMVADVMRRLGGSGLLEAHPRVAAYIARAEARPAFRRAFTAQRAVFEAQGEA
ncbi:glutathione S-transferase family protein [Sphingomonas sp. ST-64]|uniref:Glutathione S-transferase family protein n=1 Tax=Sphingomonas plantiphila TaxID=3163295 RepID=A0ABW8YP37_9SPHN